MSLKKLFGRSSPGVGVRYLFPVTRVIFFIIYLFFMLFGEILITQILSAKSLTQEMDMRILKPYLAVAGCQETSGVDPQQLYLFGRSLGGCVAVTWIWKRVVMTPNNKVQQLFFPGPSKPPGEKTP